MADLTIEHVASGKFVDFQNQGLRVFTENYNLEWNSENVFGKMDPIMSYKTTNKSLSIEFIVTGDAVEAAVDLSMYMYPTQKRDGNALYIKDPPLLRVYFKGLIQSQDDTGLLCACTNFSLERGQFYNDTTTSKIGTVETGESSGTPEATQIVVQMDLVPLHEFELGFRKIATKDEEGNLLEVYEFAPEAYNTGFYVSSTKLTTGK